MAALRFDHHQRGFFETFDGEPGVAKTAAEATGKFKTKLSACGLVSRSEQCGGLEGPCDGHYVCARERGAD